MSKTAVERQPFFDACARVRQGTVPWRTSLQREDLLRYFDEIAEDGGAGLPVDQAGGPGEVHLQGHGAQGGELGAHVGREQADVPVLKGADQGVGIHHAGIFADADLRVVLLDVLPEAGQALEAVYDDVLPAEVVQREGFTVRQGMVGGHHAVPALPEEGDEGAPGGMGPGTVVVFHHVQGAAVQVGEELVLALHHRLLDDVRVSLEKGAAEAGEQVRLEAENRPDADGVVEGVGFPAAVEQVVQVRADFGDAVEERLARGGQADTGNAAVEEFEADFGFQPVHLLLQGRGSEEQRFRRGVEAAVLGDGNKGVQVLGVHGCSPAKDFQG